MTTISNPKSVFPLNQFGRLLEAVKFTETNMRLPEIGRTRVFQENQRG